MSAWQLDKSSANFYDGKSHTGFEIQCATLRSKTEWPHGSTLKLCWGTKDPLMVKLAFSEIDRPTGRHSCRAAQHCRPPRALGHIALATFTFSCVCRGLLPVSSASVLLRVFCLKYQPCVSTFCPRDKEPAQCAQAQLGSVCVCVFNTLGVTLQPVDAESQWINAPASGPSGW